MNEYTIADIYVGLTESFNKTITVEMEQMFRQISGDENPLHINDEYARNISHGKFPTHAVFGMLTASLYSTMAGMYLPGKYSLIHSFDELAFTTPVFVGDELSVIGEVVDKDDTLGLIRLNIKIRNQNNKIVSRAKMKVLVMK